LILSFSTIASTTKSLWPTASSGFVDNINRDMESVRNLSAFAKSSCKIFHYCEMNKKEKNRNKIP
jgi:hypothetical protein